MKLTIDDAPIHFNFATMFPKSLELTEKFYLLTGENGIGKSQWMNYFIQQHKQYQQELSFCFQDKILPFNQVTLDEVKKLWKSLFGKRFLEDQFDELKKILEIDFLETPLRDLSGGQMQMVKLILCLSLKAKWYFLDEPLQFLSLAKKRIVIDYLKKINQTSHIFVIEHTEEFLEFHPYKIQMHKTSKGIEWI